MKGRDFAFAGLVLLLFGCGGGQGTGGGSSDTVHKTSLGQASVTYMGKIVPADVFSENGVTISTMAGASFTNVTLSPVQALQNSLIAFTEGGEVWTVQNGVQTQVTHGLLGYNDVATSKTGLLAFTGYDGSHTQIYVSNFDGSGLRKVTTSAIDKATPSWSPSGSKIVFGNGNNSTLMTVNADGSGETTLAISGTNLAPESFFYPAWSPDGSTIAFSGFNSSSSENSIWTVSSSGGTATEFTSGYSNNCVYPCWSPDGTEIAFVEAVSNSSRIDALVFQTKSGGIVATPSSGTTYIKPSFSPDGGTLAFQAYDGTNTYIDTQVVGQNGAIDTIASPVASGLYPNLPAWSAFFGTKTFIGSGGQMSTAAGFLWTQKGDGFGSFITVAATTPSKCTVVAQPAGGPGAPAVYLASADAITKIVYSNSYYGALTAVTPTGAGQALISVSTASGQVAVIAPLAEKASPSVASKGSLGYDGKFTAIYDAQGKNLAPSGASHIELDKTGVLVSLR